ncbi:hypothetical protein [Thalassobacillus hwangdonensis]|uniref:2TM domain-containing protein n=1 Tax=Thalassobacillus hwangdonensis TaxID=546108 RepID=A0ABW3L133_9BACI
MIGWLIIACEVGFWVFVLAGLFARYILKKKRLGLFLLICTPLVDIVLLVATVLDLKNGAVATEIHGIAAVYLGISVAFGHRMIKWADQKFYKFVHKEKAEEKIKLYGREKAKHEREGWYRHLLAWMIGAGILVAITMYIGDREQTEALKMTLQVWSMALVLDFVISFSYTIFPSRQKA